MEMKSALRQRRTPNNTTADKEYGKPATPVRCKCCNRPFAIISSEGGLSLSTPHQQACALCEPFLGLYDTLRATEQEHTALLDRGSKHHGRILAHEQLRKARVALENFLVSVEAPSDAFFDASQAGSANCTEAASLERAQESTEGPKHGDDPISLDHASPLADHASYTADLPTTKRKLSRNSGASYLERKRIKFCEDVEERVEYRGTLEYYRGAKEYVPGRYAVTKGSEYEDTSGSTLSFARFTGQKKVGSKFFDIVPKEEAQDGGDETSAVKKTGKGRSEKAYDLTCRPDMPQKYETQMNSRELRLSRRAKLNTPAAMTRLPSMSAQHDGQEGPHDSPEMSDDATDKVVALKVSNLSNIHVLTKGDPPVPVPEDVGESPRSPGGVNLDMTTLETIDHALVSQIVSNIHHELKSLQQTTVCSIYMATISKAIRGCFQALEPLEYLDCNHPRHTDEAEHEQDEDDSIYFEASDGIGGAASRVDGPSDLAELVSKRNHATVQDVVPRGPKVNLALDSKTLKDMSREDDSDLPGVSELENIDKQDSVYVTLPVSLIETYREKAQQMDTEGSTKVIPCSEYQDGHTIRPVATPSHTSEKVATILRSRSRRTSSTVTSDDQLPGYCFDEVSAISCISRSQKPRAASLGQSSALLYPAVADLRGSEQHGSIVDNSNTNIAGHVHAHALKPDKSRIATKGPHGVDEDVPPSCPDFRTSGIDASPDNNQTEYQLSLDLLEPTLDASLIQPPRIETAEDLHQDFGKWINVQDEMQGTYRPSETKAYDRCPPIAENDGLGIAPTREAAQKSEVLITDTDRHRAEQEARVGPDTAHDSAGVTTNDDRGHSADHKVENIIGTSDTVLQDAANSPRNPRDTIGDSDEANVKMVVEIPRIYHTAATQVEGQNGSLHLIGSENSELESGWSAVKDVSRKEDRQRSSSRIDKDNTEDETRLADAAFAAPQINRGHGPAPHDPSQSCTPDVRQRTSKKSLHSGTALRTDEPPVIDVRPL